MKGLLTMQKWRIIIIFIVLLCELFTGCSNKGSQGKGAQRQPLLIYIPKSSSQFSMYNYLNKVPITRPSISIDTKNGTVVFGPGKEEALWYPDIATIFHRAGITRSEPLLGALGYDALSNVFFLNNQPTLTEMKAYKNIFVMVDSQELRPPWAWGWYKGRENVQVYVNSMHLDVHPDGDGRLGFDVVDDSNDKSSAFRRAVAWVVAHEIGHGLLDGFIIKASHHYTDSRYERVTCVMAGTRSLSDPGWAVWYLLTQVINKGDYPDWCEEHAKEIRRILGGY